jgi:hypothetical protein
MLTSYKIKDYCKEYNPDWAAKMPDGCPPEEVLVPTEHPFFRLSKQNDVYTKRILNHTQKQTLLVIGESNYLWLLDYL